MGGLELENDYPYDAEDEKCHFNKTLAKVQISGAVNISSNESDMQKWLVQNGPISIGNDFWIYIIIPCNKLGFVCNQVCLQVSMQMLCNSTWEVYLIHLNFYVIRLIWITVYLSLAMEYIVSVKRFLLHLFSSI